jgi:two-component system chemotaxis response regulator CheB
VRKSLLKWTPRSLEKFAVKYLYELTRHLSAQGWQEPVAHRDIVVIGTSAGGLQALQQILSALPRDVEAALLVVLHTANRSGESMLPQILERKSNMPVSHPRDGDPILRGRIYIAPPGFHMIVEDGFVRVLQGPRENLHRPAIDPLFRSAAAAYGRRVIGVILTGMLDDGTAGLMVVNARGGEAIVQDPQSASFPSMPKSALNQVPNAHVLPLDQVAAFLLHLIGQQLPSEPETAHQSSIGPEKETRIAALNMDEVSSEDRLGQPSPFACPDCDGVLWEIEQSGFLRFRCRVGHAFTAQHLGLEQRQAVETALWEALRALEESASLYRRMAGRANDSRHEVPARLYQERAADTESNSKILRDFLLRVNLQENGSDAENALSQPMSGASASSESAASKFTARQPASTQSILPGSAANGGAFDASPE